MKLITNKKIYILIISFILFNSCKKLKRQDDNITCSFQNLICARETTPNSTEIRNIESFLLFGNDTNDTIRISLKRIQETYKHIYEKDTLSINFEATNLISIPPHDSLGVPCISIFEKRIKNNDSIFKKGFQILNIKTKKRVKRTSEYRLEKAYEFQLYKKWGRKSNKVDL